MRLNRREFLTTTAATAATATTGLGLLSPWLCNRVEAADAGKLRITGIEWDEILVPYHSFNSQALFRYHGRGLQLRTIFRVRTNSDLVGLGESWGAASMTDKEMARYVGTSPFQWLGDRRNLFLNMALYDLMGKSLGLPAWRLPSTSPANASWSFDQKRAAWREAFLQAGMHVVDRP